MMQCMYELYSWAYATLRYVTLFRKETIIYISFIKWASCVLGHINTHVSPVEQENLTTLHLSPKWASRDRKVSLSRRLTFSLSRQRSIRSDRDGGSKASSFTEADGVTSYHPLRLVFQISDFSSIPSATPPSNVLEICTLHPVWKTHTRDLSRRCLISSGQTQRRAFLILRFLNLN